jgi:hypothetical protein
LGVKWVEGGLTSKGGGERKHRVGRGNSPIGSHIMRGAVSSPHIRENRAIFVYIRDTLEEMHRYGGEKPGGVSSDRTPSNFLTVPVKLPVMYPG